MTSDALLVLDLAELRREYDALARHSADERDRLRGAIETLTTMAEAHVRGDATVSPEAIVTAGRAFLAETGATRP